MPAIRSREMAQAQRTGVRHCEDSLKGARFRQWSARRPFRPNIQHERGGRQTGRHCHAKRVGSAIRHLLLSGIKELFDLGPLVSNDVVRADMSAPWEGFQTDSCGPRKLSASFKSKRAVEYLAIRRKAGETTNKSAFAKEETPSKEMCLEVIRYLLSSFVKW